MSKVTVPYENSVYIGSPCCDDFIQFTRTLQWDVRYDKTAWVSYRLVQIMGEIATTVRFCPSCGEGIDAVPWCCVSSGGIYDVREMQADGCVTVNHWPD